MENLPLEITVKILFGLPTDSQLQCREVCTTWRSFLPKPRKGLLYKVVHHNADELKAEFFFSEQDEQGSCLGTLTKLDHDLIMPTSTVYISFMVGSCKGLVCYASSISRERRIYISNPVTGEEIQLPPIIPGGTAFSERAIGFGHSRSSNEYKVVRILMNNDLYRDGMVQVYTLRGDAVWRSKTRKSDKPILTHLRLGSSAGVFSCGSLYWMNNTSTKPKIVSFNLEDEKFDLIPSVHYLVRDDNHSALIELGGNLCVLELVPSKNVSIWELRRRKTVNHTQEQDNVSPWVLKWNIAWEEYSCYLRQSDKCLLWYNAVISCYDPETKTFRKLVETLKKLKDDCTPSAYTTTRATPFVNSLVSLKQLWRTEVERTEKLPTKWNKKNSQLLAWMRFEYLVYKNKKMLKIHRLELSDSSYLEIL